uniref:Uncharacterized protein n=1 Tax=Bionectria ochroleuca TaxID=29856 RepID=A0A0B7KBX0_BIOOC
MPPDPLKPGRFVIRHRRGADNSVDEDSSITRLCTLLQLDKNHTSHLGTTKTEEYFLLGLQIHVPRIILSKEQEVQSRKTLHHKHGAGHGPSSD